jgi:hypothetical protein
MKILHTLYTRANENLEEEIVVEFTLSFWDRLIGRPVFKVFTRAWAGGVWRKRGSHAPLSLDDALLISDVLAKDRQSAAQD